MKGYYIYFYYDKNDELLYIGQAVDVGKRWQSHQEPWKKEVCKIGVREYPDHASMDVFEHYYITKLPTKYNKGLLNHGYTTMYVPDSSLLTMYTLEEFKKKFISSFSPTPHPKPILYNTCIESLAAKGINVIETKEVNLLDEKLLSYDLDKTWFKHNGVFFCVYPGRFDLEDKAYNGSITNKRLLGFSTVIKNAFSLTKEELLVNVDEKIVTKEKICDADKFGIFDFKFVKKYKNGREYFGNWTGFNLFGGLKIWKENSTGKYLGKMRFSRITSELQYIKLLDKNNFIIDLSKVTETDL